MQDCKSFFDSSFKFNAHRGTTIRHPINDTCSDKNPTAVNGLKSDIPFFFFFFFCFCITNIVHCMIVKMVGRRRLGIQRIMVSAYKINTTKYLSGV